MDGAGRLPSAPSASVSLRRQDRKGPSPRTPTAAQDRARPRAAAPTSDFLDPHRSGGSVVVNEGRRRALFSHQAGCKHLDLPVRRWERWAARRVPHAAVPAWQARRKAAPPLVRVGQTLRGLPGAGTVSSDALGVAGWVFRICAFGVSSFLAPPSDAAYAGPHQCRLRQIKPTPGLALPASGPFPLWISVAGYGTQ